MKKILLLALPLMVMCAVSCEKEAVWTDDSPIIQFKDPRFLKVILENGNDRNNDGQISEKEASVVEALYLSDKSIRNMDEIKYFTALRELNCSDNQLTSLDLSKNTALTIFSCVSNQLTSLDVSKNTALIYLWCYDNQLTSLDVSKNTALIYLRCYDNQLTSLDLHNNRLLENLYISNNPLQKLILYKYHIIKDSDMEDIESEYGDIIEYME